MRFKHMKARVVLPGLLAVFALSAVSTSAAQASIEGPHWKVAGARLGEGQSKEVTSKTGTIEFVVGEGTLESITKCAVKIAPGAKIIGSHTESSGTAEMKLEFLNCEGEGRCSFSGSLTTEQLRMTLALVEKSVFKKGDALEAWLTPTGNNGWMKIKYVGSCPSPANRS